MGIFDRMKKIWQSNVEAEMPGVVERDLTNMRVGDIVSHDLIDYRVEGVTVYRSGGQVRLGYLLEGAAGTRYLLVEQKERVRAYLFETLNARLENPEEINHEMIFEDKSYFETVRGESSVSVQGKSAFVPYDAVYWWLHLADDGDALLFEWQNGEVLIRLGKPVKPFEVNILAGSE
jgi:hypothetical protein